MPHPLVAQLRFTRSEFIRCLEGVSEEDACRRLMPMNSIGWIVGHLANQEQFLWVLMAQQQVLVPDLHLRVGYGHPATTPPLAEMWDVWKRITAAADVYLDTLTPDILQSHLEWEGQPWGENVGTSLQRNLYHYWFHTGEAYAVREMLGHGELPEFVGNFAEAIYHPTPEY